MLRFLVRLTGACVAFSLAWRFIGRAYRGAPLIDSAPLSAMLGPYVVTITGGGE